MGVRTVFVCKYFWLRLRSLECPLGIIKKLLLQLAPRFPRNVTLEYLLWRHPNAMISLIGQRSRIRSFNCEHLNTGPNYKLSLISYNFRFLRVWSQCVFDFGLKIRHIFHLVSSLLVCMDLDKSMYYLNSWGSLKYDLRFYLTSFY